MAHLQTPQVRLLLSFGRSGGTLLSRCLKAMAPEALFLSEIHPAGDGQPQRNFSYQLQHWLKIATEQDHASYAENLEKLLAKAKETNQAVIIRDFSERDYHQNGAGTLAHLKILQQSARVLPLALVRNPIDLFISRKYDPSTFKMYAHFLEDLREKQIPIIRYEDLCANPQEFMQKVAEAFALHFNKNFLRFYEEHQVTGDNNYLHTATNSLSTQSKQILSQKRKRIPFRIRKQMYVLPDFERCMEIGGYDPDYFAAELEPFSAQVKVELKYWWKTLTRAPFFN